VVRRVTHNERVFCVFQREVFSAESKKLFILQCNAKDANRDLIACARYNIDNEFSNQIAENTKNIGNVHVVFVIQLPRVAGGCFIGFQVLIYFCLT